MVLLVGIAFLAGVVTAISPCVLPVLPIVFAGGASGGGRRRPVAIVAGIVVAFTTSLLAEYLTAERDARVAAVVYSGVMLAMAVAFSVLYAWGALHPPLLRDGVDPAAARASIPRFTAGTVLYLATVGVALLSAPLCLAVHFLLAVYYSFQQLTRRAG